MTVALDNTWGAGLAFDPFRSAPATAARRSRSTSRCRRSTKYPSGGGDVLMGSVTTRDEALHLAHQGRPHADRLRRRRQRRRARAALAALARRCATRRRTRAGRALAAVVGAAGPRSCRCCIRRCRDRPATSTGQRVCSDAAGLFSVVFDERFTRAQVDAFVDALKLFRIGYSWAGPVSLVVPYDLRRCAKQPRWPRHAGALLARPRSGRRPDRRLRAGAAGARRRLSVSFCAAAATSAARATS